MSEFMVPDSIPNFSEATRQEAKGVFEHFSRVLSRIGANNFNDTDSFFEVERLGSEQLRLPGERPIGMKNAYYAEMIGPASDLLQVMGRLATDKLVLNAARNLLHGANWATFTWNEGEGGVDPTSARRTPRPELVGMRFSKGPERRGFGLRWLGLDENLDKKSSQASWQTNWEEWLEGGSEYVKCRAALATGQGMFTRDRLRVCDLGPLHLMADAIDTDLPPLVPEL